MDIINFDDRKFDVIDADSYRNASIYLPQACRRGYRMLINGFSGSGKTNLLMNLLVSNKGLQYDRIFIVSPSINYQNKYLHLRDVMERYDQAKLDLAEKTLRKPENADLKLDDLDLNIPTAQFFESTEEMKDSGFDIDNLPEGKVYIAIFDDVLLDKNQTEYISLFSRGRQRGINCIYLSQRYYNVPKMIRANLSHCILYRGMGNSELLSVMRDLCPELDKKEARKIYNEATKDKFGFLLLDKSEFHHGLQYRRGFTDVWIR